MALGSQVVGQLGSIGPYVNLITGAAGALVVLVFLAYLFITDRLHSSAEYKRAVKQAAEWKALYEREAGSHRQTRDALVVANERAEAAVETARVTRQLLEALRPPPALPPGQGGGPP